MEHAPQPAELPLPAGMGGTPGRQRRNLKLLAILVGVIAFMLLSVFLVIVPLYNLLCRAAGAQMNPNNAAVAAAAPNASGRTVEVWFESKVFDNLPVRFYADQPHQTLELGTELKNVYHFQNLSDRSVRFRPIHQVSPSQVAEHFGMKVCFCFNDQEIGPGETREFTVVYTISPEADKRVRDVTICYSLLALLEGETHEASVQRAQQTTAGQGAILTPQYREAKP